MKANKDKYQTFRPKNPNVMGIGIEYICNGCGTVVFDRDMISHQDTCLITQIRLTLLKKNKHIVFTNAE